MDIEALQAQYDMGECGEVQNDSDESAEDDPDLNEDEPPEAPSTQSSLRGLTGQQSHSQQGNHNFPSHHFRLVICYDLYIIAHSQIMNWSMYFLFQVHGKRSDQDPKVHWVDPNLSHPNLPQSEKSSNRKFCKLKWRLKKLCHTGRLS